ncbi:DUF6388 family protein [Tatumella punctata]|uniref:DUF6388 family protein n=1 Tax=Tatumella punctata TaxID=399969 RepID=A0ABW1VRB2_9GAMM
MKNYHQMSLDDFIHKNHDIYYKIRKDSMKNASALGLSVQEYIELKLSEAHDEFLTSIGVQDRFEYFVNTYEPNTELALTLIQNKRDEKNGALGID